MLLVLSEEYSGKPVFRERWQMLAQGKMEIEVVPGSTHRSLLLENETHIQQLAESIHTYLAQLDTNVEVARL